MDSMIQAKANEILERSQRIPYNPAWTLLEQNQLMAAHELAILVLQDSPCKHCGGPHKAQECAWSG